MVLQLPRSQTLCRNSGLGKTALLFQGETDISVVLQVQLVQQNLGLFHFHRAAFSDHLQAKVGSTLTKAEVLRINLNIDGAPILARIPVYVGEKKTIVLFRRFPFLDFRGILSSVVFIVPIFFKHVHITSCWVHPMLSVNTVCAFAFSLLLTSSLSLGVPVPRTTQCIRDV